MTLPALPHRPPALASVAVTVAVVCTKRYDRVHGILLITSNVQATGNLVAQSDVVALDSRSHASSNYVDSATHKKTCCQESNFVRLSETVIEAGCRIQASFASLTFSDIAQDKPRDHAVTA